MPRCMLPCACAVANATISRLIGAVPDSDATLRSAPPGTTERRREGPRFGFSPPPAAAARAGCVGIGVPDAAPHRERHVGALEEETLHALRMHRCEDQRVRARAALQLEQRRRDRRLVRRVGVALGRGAHHQDQDDGEAARRRGAVGLVRAFVRERALGKRDVALRERGAVGRDVEAEFPRVVVEALHDEASGAKVGENAAQKQQ